MPVTFKGNPVKLAGAQPAVGSAAPDFSATAIDLAAKKLSDYKGKVVVISSVPSLDTGICDLQTKRFNTEAGKLGDKAVVLTISYDLPFAQKRWCGAADAKNVVTLSAFRDESFAKAYGLKLADGPLAGLLARSVIVVGKDGKIAYQEVCPEITKEPAYDPALAAVQAAAK